MFILFLHSNKLSYVEKGMCIIRFVYIDEIMNIIIQVLYL